MASTGKRVPEGRCMMDRKYDGTCFPKCDKCGFNVEVAARRARYAQSKGRQRGADGLWGYHYPSGV